MHWEWLSDGIASCLDFGPHDAVPEYASFKVPQGNLLCETQLLVDERTFSDLSQAAARMKADILHREILEDNGIIWSAQYGCESWPTVELTDKTYIFDQVGEHADLYNHTYIGWRSDELHRIDSIRADLGRSELLESVPAEVRKVALGIERPTVINKDGARSGLNHYCDLEVTNWTFLYAAPSIVAERPKRVFIIDSGSSTNVMNE